MSSVGLGPAVKGVAGTALIAVAYEFGRSVGLLPGTLPYSAGVARAAVGLAGDGEFWSNAWVTARGALVGLTIATVAGVALGSLLGASRWAHRVIALPVELVRSVPAVALAPLLQQALGRGLASRSLAVAYAATWPVMFNTLYGVRHVDRVATDTARSFRIGRLARLARVSLPSTLPFAFTGVRVALGIAVIVEVGVEILVPDAANAGIGGFIVLTGINGADEAARLDVYAAAVLAGVLGLGLSGALALLERRWLGWPEAAAR